MKTQHNWRMRSVAMAGALFLAACASTPASNDQLERARAAVNRVEAMPESSTLASAELKDAQESLRKTEDAVSKRKSAEEVAALAYITEKQADLAEAKLREANALEATRNMEAERNEALLQAREREATEAQQRAQAAEAALAELKARQTDRGMVMTLGDVLFDTGKATLKPGAQLTLDRLAGYLAANPSTRVIIEGHTDSTGSDATNQALSEQRASSVADALRMRGIGSDRVEIVGLGEAYPVASNASPAGRTQNRRVEIVLSDEQGQFPDAAHRAALNRS